MPDGRQGAQGPWLVDHGRGCTLCETSRCRIAHAACARARGAGDRRGRRYWRVRRLCTAGIGRTRADRTRSPRSLHGPAGPVHRSGCAWRDVRAGRARCKRHRREGLRGVGQGRRRRNGAAGLAPAAPVPVTMAAAWHGDSMTARVRADRLLVERGLFESRAKAQAAIEAGLVIADEQVVRKASEEIAVDADLRAGAAHPYVSRGGLKLAAALDHFGFDPKGRVCLDVGASTGGFTQVLLERGARRVFAVDVGCGQLHANMRARPEVVSLEETDIRTLPPARLDGAPDLIVIDVSFISLKFVLPAASALAKTPCQLVALIKPQFEAGRAAVKKGVVRDQAIHTKVCDEIAAFAVSLGWRVLGVIPSPITGGDGNAEFLLGASRD